MIDSGSVKHFPVSINEDNLEKGVFQVLQHVRPNWSDDVKLKLLTDGNTNKLMRCHEGVKEDDVVLVRVYGRKTDLFIDRTAETKNIILLHNQNLAPKIYATFNNGLVYEYVHGQTLNRDNITLPKIFLLVAAKMAKLHLVKKNEEMNCEPIIWDKIDRFYDLVPEKFTQSSVQKRFKKLNITKKKLSKEIKHLKEVLSNLSSPIVFCHNDLLLGNIIYNSDNETVTFIDYEYSEMNYQAFDIGNHFNEFAGVENIDYSRYPGKTFQTAWLYEYLRVYHGRDDISFKEIDEMYVIVNKFGLLSHVLWGLWALIQAEHSTINFDFIQFASDHLKRYFDTKNEFLALKAGQNNECQLKNYIL